MLEVGQKVHATYVTFSVDSSVIKHFAYLVTDGSLYVRFASGAEYCYFDVSAEDMTALLSADSVGKAYNAVIRGKYTNMKVA